LVGDATCVHKLTGEVSQPRELGARMRILVTGHHGYIGSVAVSILAAAGHDLTGLDTFLYEGCDLVPGEEIPSMRRDVRDVQAADLRPFDAVVHLAALSNDPLGDLRPELTHEINFEATVGLASAAKAAGVGRFVFASSCSMYGAADTAEAIDETGELRPMTAYAESKVRSEAALSRLADDSFSPISMRNATAYGASPRLRVDVVLNNLVGWAMTTGRIRIMSDGTPWRPLVHVRDIARAIVALLDAPHELVHGESFNIGADGQNYQVRELAEIVREVVPGCEIEYAGDGGPDPRSYRVDFGKLARVLPEFELEWTARAGAVELAEAYEAAGLTFREFDGDRYVRVRHLTRLLAERALDDDLRWRKDSRDAAA
jgi:nucleoside-diphosphate-sugar epimerase